jgi:hypothetical protein
MISISITNIKILNTYHNSQERRMKRGILSKIGLITAAEKIIQNKTNQLK